MTVAVFGGSFSPVHKGHMEVARAILDKGMADKVWLMPCLQNPLKEESPDVTGRIGLLRMAADYYRRMGYEGMEICLEELSMPEPSYTVRTLQRLREKNPGTDFRLVVGSDSYKDFEKWKDYRKLENEFSPIVYPRPGFPVGSVRPGWTLLDGVRELDISSTEIRRRMACGEFPGEMMPWVEAHKNQCYGK